MHVGRTARLAVIVAAALAIGGGILLAQQDTGRPDRGERPTGGEEGRRRFDPEQMRQRMMERYQEQLGASDEEWAVISPRLEKVMELSRDTRGGGMGGFFGRRSMGGSRDRRGPSEEGENAEEQSAVAKAADALRTTLEDTGASVETIKKQLTAYREAREKARQELARAQTELREVLSLRQEAQLVLMGMLD